MEATTLPHRLKIFDQNFFLQIFVFNVKVFFDPNSFQMKNSSKKLIPIKKFGQYFVHPKIFLRTLNFCDPIFVLCGYICGSKKHQPVALSITCVQKDFRPLWYLDSSHKYMNNQGVVEDNRRWKTTVDGRQPLVEEDHS